MSDPETRVDRPVGRGIVRGSTGMKGDFNRPEQNAETLRDGCLHTGDADFQQSGILDSFGTTERIAFLEETFGIRLGADPIHANRFRSVETLTGTVERAMGRKIP